VHVVGIGKQDQPAVAERLATELEGRGLTVLLDDRRKVSPGVAFKDAELLGIPTSVVVGKGLADGQVEVKDRRTGEVRAVPVDEVVDAVVAEVRA
jgi:prolyl-tRNA synthetase